MIVKDEEDLLFDALASVSFADEIILGIDDRTTDRTADIGKLFRTRTHYTKWQDDFSKARNEGLKKARKDWVLVIDADDRLTEWGRATIKEMLRRPRGDVEVYGLLIENRRLDGTLMKVDPLPSVRLFPNYRGIHYVNRAHEVLRNRAGHDLTIGWLRGGIAITHLGYDPTLYTQRGKDERNMRLIWKQLEDEPHDRLLWYQLAQQHIIGGRFENARAAAQVALEHVPGYLRPELIAELEQIAALDSVTTVPT